MKAVMLKICFCLNMVKIGKTPITYKKLFQSNKSPSNVWILVIPPISLENYPNRRKNPQHVWKTIKYIFLRTPYNQVPDFALTLRNIIRLLSGNQISHIFHKVYLFCHIFTLLKCTSSVKMLIHMKLTTNTHAASEKDICGF